MNKIKVDLKFGILVLLVILVGGCADKYYCENDQDCEFKTGCSSDVCINKDFEPDKCPSGIKPEYQVRSLDIGCNCINNQCVET